MDSCCVETSFRSEPDSGSGTGNRCDKPYGHTDSAAHILADEVKNNEEPCGVSHHTRASDKVNMENNSTFRSTAGWYRAAGNSFWVKFIVDFFLAFFALGSWLAKSSPAVKPMAAIFVSMLVFSLTLVSGCCFWPCFKQSSKLDNLGASDLPASCCDYPESSDSVVKEIEYIEACKKTAKLQTSTEDDEEVDFSSESYSLKESSSADAEFSSRVRMLILVSVSMLVVVAFAVLFPGMVCNLQKMDPPSDLPSIKFLASRSLSSNYTNTQWFVGTGVTVSSALLKVVTAFALSFSCLVIEVLSSASQFLTFRQNVDRKASSIATVTMFKSSYHFLNVARAVTFMAIFAGQIPLVGSESLTNATNANHSICLPSDRPVYQCGLQPPEYVCPVSLRYEHNGLDLSPLIVNHILIPEFIKKHHPSPKHLVSLTYLKTPIPSAAENKVIVPLLCASVFFLGPCFPYLAIIYFLVNPIAANVFWRSYNWFIGIVWGYGVLPLLLWLRNVVLNGASWLFRGAVFMLQPRVAPFLLLSVVSVALCAYAGWYGEVILLASFDSHLLEMSGSAAFLVFFSVLVLQPLNVELVPPPGGVDGRDHVRLAEYLPPPPREIIQPSPRGIIQPPPQEIIQPSPREIIQPPSRPPPQEIIRPPPQEIIQPPPQEIIQPPPQEIIQPPPQEILQPSPREIIQLPPHEIIQPSVRPKPGNNLRKRGVGFLVYDIEDPDRVVQVCDASTPHFVGSYRLLNPRQQLCYLPEPTFLVLHNKVVTIEEPSDGPCLSTDIGHRSAAFDRPCISVASLVERGVSSSLALLRSFEEEVDAYRSECIAESPNLQ